jgi:drug/metabolite transporter (DMT)-like permease
MERQHKGIALGLVAIIAFGLTLPITRFIGTELDPVLISFGRSAIAGLVAAAILHWRKISFPTPNERRQLWMVIAGVVLGFPLFSVWAMQLVSSAHGGVVMGLLPLLTALAGSFVAGEKPSVPFWMVSLLGGVLVVLYMMPAQGLRFQLGDLLLLLASISAAVGYAFGGKLSRQIPGWQVICWALVLALPLTVPPFLWRLPEAWQTVGLQSWLGFLYLALVSQLFGFFLWYRAFALGGIARISQVQLLQPFVTIVAAGLWLREQIHMNTLIFAGLIICTVFISQKMTVSREGES